MANANWFLIACVTFLPGIESLNWTIPNESHNLADVTLFIAREHLSKLSSTVVITEQSITPATAKTNFILLDYLLNRLQGTVAVQLHIGNTIDQLWEYYIFIIDSMQALRVLSTRFPLNFNERRFFFLIVLTKFTPNFYNMIERIFTLCYHFNIINVNIILDHPRLGISMFTYTLFSNADCRVVQPLLLFRFNKKYSLLKEVFPMKLTNFHKCPIRVTSRSIPPMIIFSGNTSDPKPVGLWENLSGVDGTLLKFLAVTLNFTIEIVSFPTERSYVENATAYGCFAELVNGKSDLALGSFSGSDPNRWVISPSVFYYNSPFVFVVRGGQLMRGMSRLARPFHNQVWVLLALIFTFVMITVQILRFMKPAVCKFVAGDQNDAPTMNLVAATLGYPVSRPPRRNFARYILMLWLLLTLILRNSYQGALYDAFRLDKFVQTPSGLDDLIKWNYKFLVSPDLAQLDMFPKTRTNVLMDGEYLERFKIIEGCQGKYATATLRDNYLHYMSRINNYGSDLIMMNEAVYMYPIAMYFSKHSILLDSFNTKLKSLTYSGLTRYVGSKYIAEPNILRRAKEKLPKTAIDNSRLEAVYEIYAFMMLLAALVFSVELLSIYCKRLRRIIQWLN